MTSRVSSMASHMFGGHSKAGYSRLRTSFALPSSHGTAAGNGNGNQICCCIIRKTKCLMLLLLLAIASIIGYGVYYHCPAGSCKSNGFASKSFYISGNGSSSKNNSSKGNARAKGGKAKYNLDDDLANQLIVLNQRDRQFTSTVPVNFVDYASIHQKGLQFDLEGNDVMVFLHIQKTGGTTFERHLVHDIDLEAPCQSRGGGGGLGGGRKKGRKKGRKNRMKNQRFECFRPGSTNSWLFSRYNTGWKCGLHADWTELTECVDSYLDAKEGVANRAYFYMTFLREPVTRYLSEYLHVRRGATWKDSQFMCDGKPGDVTPCYDEQGDGDWSGVSLEEFSGCGTNMAFNRQTRMLSDLRLVNCYNATGMSKADREDTMLKSAKANLQKMAFFGITAQQARSQFLFEDTFNLKFKVDFEEQAEDQQSQQYLSLLTPAQLDQIRRLNRLDIELYEFAKHLMEERYRQSVQAAAAAASTVADGQQTARL